MSISAIIVDTMQRDSLRLDTIAHNLANTSTAGFKRFMAIDDGQSLQSVPDRSQGALQTTERGLDLAIKGDGFFVVTDPNGNQLLTRGGNFKRDGQGNLVTAAGLQVQDARGGAIQLTSTDNLTVGADGTLRQGKRSLGQVQVVTVPAGVPLTAVGQNTFSVPPGTSLNTGGGQVVSSALETSNVNPLTEMVSFLSVSREFEFGQKALKINFEMRNRLTDEVGKTP